MTTTLKRLLSFCSLCLLVAVASTSAFATHLRGTTVSWSPTGTTGQVQFTIQYSQRQSFGGCSQTGCPVGSTLAVPFSFGDGTSGSFNTTITSVNTAEDYLSSTGTLVHTYTTAGPFTAYYEQTARVSTIKSGHDQLMRMQTTVTPMASPANHSPVVSEPAIITLPLQSKTGFFLSASDADHDTLSYRMATSNEMYDAAAFSCTIGQPPGLTVNSSTGQVTWDTTQITKAGCGYAAPVSGDLWTVQFEVSDVDATGKVKSTVPLDIILKFVASTEAPPTLTLSNPGPITVQAGTPISFTATGNDAAANSRVTLNATGLPIGATSSNLNSALAPAVVSTFNWTPTAAQTGSYVITYSATNDTFEQVLASVTIYVQNIQPPVLSCSTALTAQYNAAVTIPLTVSDPQADAVTVNWAVDGASVRTDSVPATNQTTNLSLSQTFTKLGAHTVTATATDTDSKTSTCTTTVTVTKADQTISFSALPNSKVGSPDIALTATASSSLPVTYTASGACTIVNGAVHVTGAGTCAVTANQAGNANYNAATAVTQSFTVAKADQAITFSAPASLTVGQQITLSATGGASGNPVTYTVTGPATLTGNVLKVTGAGTVVVTANQAGNANYNAAAAVAQSIATTKVDQAITFNPPTSLTVGQQITLSATGGASGNPVTFTVTGPATLTGNVLKVTGAGTVVVTANQAGDATYNAAPAVVRSIAAKATATVTLSASSTTLTYPESTNLMACAKLVSGVTANGTISIYDGATLVTTLKTQGDGCIYPYLFPMPSAGTHSLTAVYTDALNNNGTSNVVTLKVNIGAVTTEVDCWVHDAAYGGDIKCDANPDSGPKAGYMVYSYDNGPLVMVQMNSASHALFTIPKPLPGTHTVQITYPAQGSWGSSALPLQVFHVAQAPVNVLLAPSVYYTNAGKSVTLTASMTSTSTAAPNAVGTVSFYDGGKLLGSAAVSSTGTASFAATALTVGTHSFTASYSGTQIYAAGTGAATVSVGK